MPNAVLTSGNTQGMHAPISVIIPTYNYGRFVSDAIRSVLAQTLTPKEIIVVDDGSTDDTASRVQEFHGRIRYVHHNNSGLAATRNTGIRESRGEWIAFLDSDDVWHPQKLERQWLACHPGGAPTEVRAIGTDMLTFYDSPPAPDLGPAAQPRLSMISIEALLRGAHFSGGSGAMIHHSCFDAVGVFDPSLKAVEDLEMWARIASRFPIARLPRAPHVCSPAFSQHEPTCFVNGGESDQGGR